MTHGLQRSIDRGPGVRQDLQNISIPVNGLVIDVADGAPGFATVVVQGLPASNILFSGAVIALNLTSLDAGIVDAFDGDIALGTEPTVAGALTGAEADLAASTAIPTGVAGVSEDARAVSTTTLSGVVLDNRDGSLELNLNIAIDDASISAASQLQADGAIFISYVEMGK